MRLGRSAARANTAGAGRPKGRYLLGRDASGVALVARRIGRARRYQLPQELQCDLPLVSRCMSSGDHRQLGGESAREELRARRGDLDRLLADDESHPGGVPIRLEA